MPRRYTDAELDAYELRPIVDAATGERSSYEVWIGGDSLGRVRWSTQPRGWHAYTTTGATPVRHVGHGNAASSRQDAVVDLLTALGVPAPDGA